MKIIKIDPENPNPTILKQVFKFLSEAKTVVIPTDTVYGLAADATNLKAVKKTTQIKRRSLNKPYSVFVADLKMIKNLAQIDRQTLEILKRNLPGPFTFVLKNKKGGAIAIRMPKYPLINRLAKIFGKPLIATSANLSGQPSCYSIDEVLEQFKNKKFQPDIIFDAGVLPKSLPSTVVDLTSKPYKILRQGGERFVIEI